MSKSDSNHILQLDGIRFFAIFFVLIAHWLQWQSGFFLLKHAEFVHGVTLFFVLSGFLITRILFTNRLKYENHQMPTFELFKSFYIRRFLRIFPIYYLTIALLFIIDFKDIKEIYLYLISYTTNIHQSITNSHLDAANHFWSLAVEEQFYILWPFVIIFTPLRHLKSVIIGFIVISIATRAYIFYEQGWAWMALDYFPLSCFQSLAIGGLIAYWTVMKSDWLTKLNQPWIIWTAIGLYVVFMYTQSVLEWKASKAYIDRLFFSLVAGLIIIRASLGAFKHLSAWVLENKFVLYCGKISYGMYVYHMFMPDLFNFIGPKIGFLATNKYSQFVVYFALTFLLSHLSWKLIENPINNLKDRFPYFKNKQVAA